MQRNDLLTPSLAGSRQQVPIYSVGAMIASAFFGGAAAVPLLAAANSKRQGRLLRDAPWLAAGLLLALAIQLSWVVYFYPGTDATDARVNARLVSRAAGFALVAVYFVLLRRVYRTQRTLGLDPPSPWIPVIVTVIGGLVITTLSLTVAVAVLVEHGVIGDFP